MFGATSGFKSNKPAVDRATKKAKFTNLRHGVASMRKTAVASIKKKKDKDISSPAGTPVFTHSGLARIALQWFVDPNGNFAIMGFTFSKFGTKGETHEKGLTETEDGVSRDYPERPAIFPALESNIDRFADSWKHSIGA